MVSLQKGRRAARVGDSPLGPLDGYQWLLFMAAHWERHLGQIKEAKADAKFPRAATPVAARTGVFFRRRVRQKPEASPVYGLDVGWEAVAAEAIPDSANTAAPSPRDRHQESALAVLR